MPNTLLANNVCEACSGLTSKLSSGEISEYLEQVFAWKAVDNHHIVREWKFKNFGEALTRVDSIGAVAEKEGHHPDIRFGWGYLEITLFTHAINGLSKNDFILAAKIDALEK